MFNNLKQLFYKLNYKWKRRDYLNALILGKIYAEKIKSAGPINSILDVEFQVFSQYGEDGIIQYLVNNIEIPNKVFIEIGVENYLEANTRFLLLNNRWSGLVIDGSKEAINFIKKDELVYYRSNLKAINAFVNKDNINQLIRDYTNLSDIGLLSIDIDGNDFWILEALNVIRPRILICEYNGFLGPEIKLTIPYKANFIREKEHYSYIYFGASLNAFVDLADKKGYDFIGSGTQGINAFFVRKDVNHSFKIVTSKQGYMPPLHKELRNKKGILVDASAKDILEALKEMPFWDIDLQKTVKFHQAGFSE